RGIEPEGDAFGEKGFSTPPSGIILPRAPDNVVQHAITIATPKSFCDRSSRQEFHFAHRDPPNVASMKRLSLLICAGVAMSTLSGCASEPTVAPLTAAPKTPVTTHQADDAAAAEETPADVDPATCLHGTWLADNAFFLAAIQQFGPEVQDVSGRVLL